MLKDGLSSGDEAAPAHSRAAIMIIRREQRAPERSAASEDMGALPAGGERSAGRRGHLRLRNLDQVGRDPRTELLDLVLGGPA